MKTIRGPAIGSSTSDSRNRGGVPPVRRLPYGSVYEQILRWAAAAGRELPWRRTRDPWAILVSEAMLQRARKLEPEVEFRLGDVSRLNEPDASIDAITIGFGLRNLVDREQALREMRRVLRPGRRLVILEFAPPPSGPLMRAYRLYLTRVMPAIADRLSGGEHRAYRYLAETVQGFPQPAELTASLDRLGFAVTVEPLTFGIVMLHVAVRRD